MSRKGSFIGRPGTIVSCIVVLVVLTAGCTGEAPGATIEDSGGDSSPAATGESPDVSSSETGGEYRDVVLSKEDLSGEWVQLVDIVRTEDTVPEEAREMGWKEGYVVEFGNSSGGTTVRALQVLSVYPEETAPEAMGQMYDPAEGSEDVPLDLGEESDAHRVVDNGTVTYVAVFRVDGVTATVALRGPVQEDERVRDLFWDVAGRAADKAER